MHYFSGKGCSESLESMHYCIGILTYIIRQIEKRCKIARLPDGKYLFHQAILCKHFFSFDYSADSLETEFFFFLDLPEIIL